MGIFENAFPEYVVFTQIDRAISWARSNALSYLTLDLACCGIEMLQAEGGRFDIERFGSVSQVSPRHSDLMIVAGTITYKTAETIRELYERMPLPRYVMAMGSCANCGGMFSSQYSYSTVSGLDKLIPVDIYVPGCPPRPEAVLHGLMTLQKRIAGNRLLVRDELSRMEVEIR